MAGHVPVAMLDENPGGSPVVLLLHGLGASSASWQLQIPALTRAGFRVLAPDIPGFGASKWSGRWSIRAAAEAVLGEALERAGQPMDLIGISMGGTLALRLALDHPAQVRKLVLVNTFAQLRPRSLSELTYYARRFALVYRKGLRAQSGLVAKRIFPEPDQEFLREMLIAEINQADEQVYRQAMRELGLFDVNRRLGEIRNRTLVVTASRDTTVPPAVQNQLARSIPGARQVIIEGGGHGVIADHPGEFNQAVLDFLGERET